MNEQPQSTAGMVLKMMGLGELWDAANSPGFQQQISALVQAIVETRARVEQIESKLDVIADALIPNLRSGNQPRTLSLASHVADARGAGAPADPGPNGGSAGTAGDDRPAGVGRPNRLGLN